MLKFSVWLQEAKKKGKRVPDVQTVTSSPISGANQDQGGYGVTRSVTDYTISDEKKSSK